MNYLKFQKELPISLKLSYPEPPAVDNVNERASEYPSFVNY
jgi:hypothetical protein